MKFWTLWGMSCFLLNIWGLPLAEAQPMTGAAAAAQSALSTAQPVGAAATGGAAAAGAAGAAPAKDEVHSVGGGIGQFENMKDYEKDLNTKDGGPGYYVDPQNTPSSAGQENEIDKIPSGPTAVAEEIGAFEYWKRRKEGRETLEKTKEQEQIQKAKVFQSPDF